MNQQPACMSACPKVFKFGYNTLDDQHLNKKQLKNIWKCVAKSLRSEWNAMMNDDPFLVKRSTSSQSFRQRRDAFQAKYFSSYRAIAGLVHVPIPYSHSAHRKRLQYGSMRATFLFRRSGYTETSNTIYQHLVPVKRVPIHGIPTEMRRVTENQVLLRSAERTKPCENMLRKISSYQLPIPPQPLSSFVKTYAPYMFNNFYEKSIEQAFNYAVTSARVADLARNEIDKFHPLSLQSTEIFLLSHQRSDVWEKYRAVQSDRKKENRAEEPLASIKLEEQGNKVLERLYFLCHGPEL